MEEEPQRVEGRCAWGQGEVPGSLSKRSPVLVDRRKKSMRKRDYLQLHLYHFEGHT